MELLEASLRLEESGSRPEDVKVEVNFKSY
jgi:hypothetical protein